jgi:hypothetical protein
MITNIFEDIENYMQFRELVLSFLLTVIFLFLSFVGHTRLSTTEITVGEITHTIHISYYGFPSEMIGILNPITEMENYWVYQSEAGVIRIIWSGLFLNVVLYFLLAFTLVYLFRRLRG